MYVKIEEICPLKSKLHNIKVYTKFGETDTVRYNIDSPAMSCLWILSDNVMEKRERVTLLFVSL